MREHKEHTVEDMGGMENRIGHLLTWAKTSEERGTTNGKVVENPAIKAQAVLDARLFAEAERMDKLQELEKVRRLCLCLCLPTFPSFLPHFRLYEVVSLHMCVLP